MKSTTPLVCFPLLSPLSFTWPVVCLVIIHVEIVPFFPLQEGFNQFGATKFTKPKREILKSTPLLFPQPRLAVFVLHSSPPVAL